MNDLTTLYIDPNGAECEFYVDQQSSNMNARPSEVGAFSDAWYWSYYRWYFQYR